jgi:hypothetical protein
MLKPKLQSDKMRETGRKIFAGEILFTNYPSLADG